jgi:hypothetical protein
MIRMVSRDPFAREELHRRKCPSGTACSFCPSPARWIYSVETDGGRNSDIRGAFCTIGCMRAYHGR